MPISFKSFYKKDYLEERTYEMSLDQKRTPFQTKHKENLQAQKDQGQMGKKGYTKLAKGYYYQTSKGTFAARRHGLDKTVYFPDSKHAKAWVNGHMIGNKETGQAPVQLSDNPKDHNDKVKHYDHPSGVPPEFKHKDPSSAFPGLDEPKEKTTEKPKQKLEKKVEKPKKGDDKQGTEQEGTGEKQSGDNIESDGDGGTTFKPNKDEEENVKKRNEARKNIGEIDNKAFETHIDGDDEDNHMTTGEWAQQNSSMRVDGPPPPLFEFDKSLKEKVKCKGAHMDGLERMMNSILSGAKSGKWSTFSNVPGGAGKIFAQAGELMSLTMTTLDDKDAQAMADAMMDFNKALEDEFPDLYKKDKKGKIKRNKIIDDSWIKAAMGNRSAIHNYLKKEYGDDVEIEMGGWDTEGEYNALGGSDYKNNKAFSTDVYFRIKTKDGSIMHEVSLKKSTLVNFLNSGTGKFEDWDPDLPDEIKASIYQQTQRNRLVDHVTNYFDQINPNKPPLSTLMASKEIEGLEGLITNKKKNGEWALNRDRAKVLLTAIHQLANNGHEESKEFLVEHKELGKTYEKNAIRAILENRKLTQGMMSDIKENFPIKGVADREEVMAIGEHSLDPNILKEIFGTDDYSKISENFEPMVDEKGSPYIAYVVKGSDEVIPVAGIGIREDGNGYGGQFKFEMTLHKGFAEHLKTANQAVYGTKTEEYKSIAHVIHEIFRPVY